MNTIIRMSELSTTPHHAQEPDSDSERLDTLPLPFQAHAILPKNPLELLHGSFPEEDFAPITTPRKFPPIAHSTENNEDWEEFQEWENFEGERNVINKTIQPLKIMPSPEGGRGYISSGPVELVMKAKQLYKIPKDFIKDYAHIKVLDLSRNHFKEIPHEIFALVYLQELLLNGNAITAVPKEIAKLQHLEKLALAGNAITYLDPALGKLKNTKTLLINDNDLDFLPKEICIGLTNLTTFHFYGNCKLRHIPCEFSNLINLSEFGFDWFLYFNPSGTCIMRSPLGTHYIEETRECCKFFHQRTGQTYVNYIEFMSWFSRTEENGLLSYVYYKGRSPLHLAIACGHIGVIKEIINSGVDLNIPDDLGATPFALAIKYNNAEIITLLARSNKVNVGIQCGKYGTPLHYFMIKKDYDLAEKIAENNSVKPNARDSNGNTVFHYLLANFSHNPGKTTRILHSLSKRYVCFVNAKNNANMTSLHCAAKKNQVEAIKFAIKYNKKCIECNRFDFNEKGGRHQFPLLHFIVIYTDIETTMFVLENTDIDVLATDYCGRTARELVKNTVMAKLLYKYERLKIRRTLLPRKNIVTRASTKRTLNSALKADIRPVVSTCAMYDSRMDTCEDKNAHINAMTWLKRRSEKPSLIPKIRAFETRSTPRITRKTNVTVDVDDKRIEDDSGSISDTEGRHLCVVQVPPIYATKEAGFSTTLYQKYKSSIQGNLLRTEEECALINNKFLEQCKKVLHSETRRHSQYRILYYILKKHTVDAGPALAFLLHKRLGLSLIIDIIYLLSQLEKGKVTRALTYHDQPLVAFEAINAEIEQSNKLKQVATVNSIKFRQLLLS
eukprot:TRINITY_DN135222_c0_g1_i1.p1 TRINITY_DN135222_c0_g1~~TRINITY_DN135222_c0_g1_i1.p1  ORF type:complete len:840 (-),score=50.37 TRINITY_DN135222_c0_g1_i1:65-2584(-)